MNTSNQTNRLDDIATRNTRGPITDVAFAAMIVMLLTILIGGL